MKSYKKEIAVLAAMALFTPWVNAQTANHDDGPGSTAGLQITPAGADGAGFVEDGLADPIENVIATTSEVDQDTNEITTTIVNQVASWEATYDDVNVVDIDGEDATEAVIVSSDGIVLNRVETTRSEVAFDVRVTEVSVNDGLGNVDSITRTFTAQAVDSDGIAIDGLSATGVDEEDAYNNLVSELSVLAADDASLAGVTTPGATTSAGGNLTVGGVLSLAGGDPDGVADSGDEWDAVANVAEAIGDNADDIASNDTEIQALEDDLANQKDSTVDGSLANQIAGNDGEIQALEDDLANQKDSTVDGSLANQIAGNDGEIQALEDDLANQKDSTVDGSLANQIAGNDGEIQALEDDLANQKDSTVDGSLANQIAGNDTDIAAEVSTRSALIRREGDGFVHIGENSLIFDDTNPGFDQLTSSKSNLIIGGGATTDVAIDANLDVAGDASFQQDVFVAGDIFVGGRTQGLQKQIDNNREDIDRNARGIAMVAALQHTTVLPGMKHALDLSAAHFEGETGMALNYARRINDNVQINFGAASTSDFDESVIKAGIGVQW